MYTVWDSSDPAFFAMNRGSYSMQKGLSMVRCQSDEDKYVGRARAALRICMIHGFPQVFSWRQYALRACITSRLGAPSLSSPLTSTRSISRKASPISGREQGRRPKLAASISATHCASVSQKFQTEADAATML